ncbi:hypothetical protein [Saccharococcus caldoxylosilyticus]|uniref:hypothetical protein n=1 Tax=Saccharococcus caldoxylosilyticus TaxID=81408 RepID=UPI000779C89C|nr:hypothetical protein [Parageobacillus caldoxylosilyticus]
MAYGILNVKLNGPFTGNPKDYIAAVHFFLLFYGIIIFHERYYETREQAKASVFVKADDKIPNIAGIKFPTYNRTIVSMRGAMVHDYERGIFHDQRDV